MANVDPIRRAEIGREKRARTRTQLIEAACTTWRALYVGARKLTDDVMEHIHTENNILFPRVTS